MVEIMNVEASTIFEVNNGVRKYLDTTRAMLPDSLFLDYMMNNGLKVEKGKTKDFICIKYNYGSRSYEDEVNHINKMINNANTLDLTEDELKSKIEFFESLKIEAKENMTSYVKVKKEDLRISQYNDGVCITWNYYNKDGSLRKSETLHYNMLFRSSGKAKKGCCVFVIDKLYKKAKNYLYMGIKLPKHNAPIVEIGAYCSLIASGIESKCQINPDSILVLKDVERTFKTNIISIEKENEHCVAKKKSDYDVINVLFDGESLIDVSICPDNVEGYALLRQHFFKSACFCTDIQGFFKDYFGDKYETATVKDMFGRELFAKDIRLITTDNSIKWLKFDISFDYWAKWVNANDNYFGIVKTSHPSKLGKNIQKMSYQMVNSLSEDIMESVCKKSVEYLELLKNDNDAFLDYLKKSSTFSNDYEVLIALCNHNKDFHRSTYFRDRKKDIIKSHFNYLKKGKLIEDAENLTLVGNPYALLLYAATGNPNSVDLDDTFEVEDDAIQCYTEAFEDNQYLAGFRSPFNGKYNLCYYHNVYSDKMKKYFRLGRQIMAVNCIGTCMQDRNNGCDFDSDFLYVTNQEDIVEYSKYCMKNYPTIVNNISKEKSCYDSTPDDYAKIDNNLARSQGDIGGSSNLAQLAQVYASTFKEQKYEDYICILSVAAQIAIDSSKRRFDIDITKEIEYIKKQMSVRENGYPKFWTIVNPKFNKKLINKDLKCPMNYLCDLKIKKGRSSFSTLEMDYFYKPCERNIQRKTCKSVENVIEKYSLELHNYNKTNNNTDNKEEYILLRKDFEDMIQDLRGLKISPTNYQYLMCNLINRCFLITPQMKANKQLSSKTSKNKALLTKVLYQTNPKTFLNCFNSSNTNY